MRWTAYRGLANVRWTEGPQTSVRQPSALTVVKASRATPPGRPERNRTARSFRQLRRFHHVINADKVFGTHSSIDQAWRSTARPASSWRSARSTRRWRRKRNACSVQNERGCQLRRPYSWSTRRCSRTSALYRSIWPASPDQVRARFFKTWASASFCANFIKRRHSAD